jgi:hypothetical protein
MTQRRRATQRRAEKRLTQSPLSQEHRGHREKLQGTGFYDDGKGSRRMKIVSVNVGLPREVMWHARNVTTGIYKDARSVRRALRVAALPESWKGYFRERLDKANV